MLIYKLYLHTENRDTRVTKKLYVNVFIFFKFSSLHVINFRYKVRWYITPLSIQKLIMFLLQRGNKSFGLSVGGLFVASLECFATVQNIYFIYHNIVKIYFSFNTE